MKQTLFGSELMDCFEKGLFCDVKLVADDEIR